MGPPVGPTGAVLSCTHQGDGATPERRDYRVSASATWTSTILGFDGPTRIQLRRRAVSAAFEWRALDGLTVTAGLGAAIDGDLTDGRGRRFELGPGPVGVVGVAYRVLQGEGWVPFLLVGGAASAATALSTSPDGARERYTGVDLRASVTVGEVFADTFAPYLTARAFGGPIAWTLDGRDITGSDKNHYQLGAGLLVTTGRIDASVEIVPLGERSATFGLAVSF